jgi:hypothetical protein
MQPIKRQVDAKEKKRHSKFASDEAPAASFSPTQVLIDSVKMMTANSTNKFLPPEEIITLPFQTKKSS